MCTKRYYFYTILFSNGVSAIKMLNRVTFFVTEAPVIDPMKTSSDRTAEAGQPLQLTCGAFGRPEPVIRWTRAGNGMMPGGGFVKIVS